MPPPILTRRFRGLVKPRAGSRLAPLVAAPAGLRGPSLYSGRHTAHQKAAGPLPQLRAGGATHCTHLSGGNALQSQPQFTGSQRRPRHFLGAPEGRLQPHTGSRLHSVPQLLAARQDKAPLGVPAVSLHTRRPLVLLLSLGLVGPSTAPTFPGATLHSSSRGSRAVGTALGGPGGRLQPRAGSRLHSGPPLLAARQAAGSSHRLPGSDLRTRIQKGLRSSPVGPPGDLPQHQHGLPRGRFSVPG
ncbi:hypothetical protein NDU88_002723 [Pleurodeles waltl]|uniref:Uncharacterized protein n=1 Tax=Pleurodeles waltl TaxID=8319 RepID=A0AAV7TLG8_PLEWA|nr:hypothetical protein NDU88_002723 [Pleurodeles waltl]